MRRQQTYVLSDPFMTHLYASFPKYQNEVTGSRQRDIFISYLAQEHTQRCHTKSHF